MNARPQSLTTEMKQRAARKVAEELAERGLIGPDKTDAITRDIARYAARYSDGYDLARELEQCCGWDPNAQMVEVFENFSHHASNEIAAAEKEWFTQEKPTPSFASGARIKLKSGETGVIDGIYEYGPAKYLVKIDGGKAANTKSWSRRVVNFEDAQAA